MTMTTLAVILIILTASCCASLCWNVILSRKLNMVDKADAQSHSDIISVFNKELRETISDCGTHLRIAISEHHNKAHHIPWNIDKHDNLASNVNINLAVQLILNHLDLKLEPIEATHILVAKNASK